MQLQDPTGATIFGTRKIVEANSVVEHAVLGNNCTLINSVVRGTPDHKVVIGDNVTLIGCYIAADETREPFNFGEFSVEPSSSAHATWIRGDNHLADTSVLNSSIGRGTTAIKAHVEYSDIGTDNHLLASASVSRSRTGSACTLGSEVSKCVLVGAGFTSEHTASYLSLIAPDACPVFADGSVQTRTGLPNVTNIGAGTVFANYGGEPLADEDNRPLDASAKGTAIAYCAFTAVNCRIVNGYGNGNGSLNDLLEDPAITTLCFGSFVENKVSGRIPAFSYAATPYPADHRLGWMLESKPGMVLRMVQKMRKELADAREDQSVLAGLVESVIRLEVQLLRQKLIELRNSTGSLDPRDYSVAQLEKAIGRFERHLDGRWRTDPDGGWSGDWRLDSATSKWICEQKHG